MKPGTSCYDFHSLVTLRVDERVNRGLPFLASLGQPFSWHL